MAWSVLQSNSAASAATASAAYTTGLTAGSKLIAFVEAASQTVTAVSDGAGHNFTQQAIVTTGTANLYIFTLDTPTAGATPTITPTLSGTANGSSILIQEVTGLRAGTSGILDGTAGTAGANSSGTTITTGSATYSSTAANEYLISLYADDGDNGTWANTSGAPAGYTRDAKSISGNTDGDLAVAYKNSTGGSETSNGWTISNSTGANAANWMLAVVAFKLAAGPSVAPFFPARRPAGAKLPGQHAQSQQLYQPGLIYANSVQQVP